MDSAELHLISALTNAWREGREDVQDEREDAPGA
jgi:hypothetical protein